MTEDEIFFAWLDGELDPAQAAVVEARVAASPELTALAKQHRQMAGGLRAAFDETATEAPQDIGAGAAVLPFAAPPRRAANENVRRAIWMPVAAALTIGLVTGALLPKGGDPTAAPVTVAGGQMVAAAALDQALDTQLASAGNDGPVRIGMTFRDADGKWCRSFDGAAGAGLACRKGDDWQVRALFPASGQGGDYRMAAGVDPRLAGVIDDAMQGDAADALSERVARENGWR